MFTKYKFMLICLIAFTSCTSSLKYSSAIRDRGFDIILSNKPTREQKIECLNLFIKVNELVFTMQRSIFGYNYLQKSDVTKFDEQLKGCKF